jgi:hypothetical protein
MQPTLGAGSPAPAVGQLVVDAELEELEAVDDEPAEEPVVELEDESLLEELVEVLGFAVSLEELLARESLR